MGVLGPSQTQSKFPLNRNKTKERSAQKSLPDLWAIIADVDLHVDFWNRLISSSMRRQGVGQSFQSALVRTA